MLKNLGLAALSASAVAMAFVACGPETGGDISCTSDADCTGTEICHPDARVCVETCSIGADCPDHAKTCAAISTTDDRMICQCSTNALCAGGPAGDGAVCQAAWSVCTAACETNTDCPTGFDCAAATGQCTKSTPTECTPACDLHETCDTSGATATCKAVACTASPTTQPDTCAYGAFCSGTSCATIPAATCANFVGSPHGTSWTPDQATKGAVIYSVTKDSYQAPGNNFCGAAANLARYKVKVEAYDPAGTYTGNCTMSGNPAGTPEAAVAAKLHRVDASGNEITMGGIQCVNASNGGKNITFYVNFCAASTTGYTAGMHFENGNEVCSVIAAN